MDKQMIEEMVKDINLGFDIAYDSQSSNFPQIIAETLIEKNYRKIPEGAVVLKKEEFEVYEFVKKKHGSAEEVRASEIVGSILRYIKETRKETAEKFAELKTVWKQRAKEYTDWAGNKVQAVTLDLLFDDIDEICKEIIGGDKGADLCDTCVCCGQRVPEGRQVCPRCEKSGGNGNG